MEYKEIIKEIKSFAKPEDLPYMKRYGINIENSYGTSVYKLREIAKKTGKNHTLALKLWKSKNRESRLLATMIDDPLSVSEEQIERWVKDFNSWDLCDQCCSNLIGRTKYAYKKINEWCIRKEEFVKRAGFALIAGLAVHDKKAIDKQFERFFSIIKRGAVDDRNYVKKAVNWALRQIGKRNLHLNKQAIKTAKEIRKIDSKSAKWIASDAMRELTKESVQKRLCG
jgi:3-methyladenine DNA glycosylase AlkD